MLLRQVSKDTSIFERSVENVPSFKVRHDNFKNSFFPSTAIVWNKIDKNIQKLESLNIFKKNILKFIRPSQKRVYNYLKELNY